jgi:hypothetical protein
MAKEEKKKDYEAPPTEGLNDYGRRGPYKKVAERDLGSIYQDPKAQRDAILYAARKRLVGKELERYLKSKNLEEHHKPVEELIKQYWALPKDQDRKYQYRGRIKTGKALKSGVAGTAVAGIYKIGSLYAAAGAFGKALFPAYILFNLPEMWPVLAGGFLGGAAVYSGLKLTPAAIRRWKRRRATNKEIDRILSGKGTAGEREKTVEKLLEESMVFLLITFLLLFL